MIQSQFGVFVARPHRLTHDRDTFNIDLDAVNHNHRLRRHHHHHNLAAGEEKI
ncbi:hypothetical protein CY34DRAFT_802393 [Suillus luteus UH-Slu-Lm8-n1]|uniref:Uncharacterized protein n=1 Tax=Suillus luteus UH-Slu-Lm8-n1 TaxID=930992 RepID=A0A0D0B440_9AGAM|nr:hypothetical protein CY34DRAFT_802393 [Suillus luteus UH-Slu-Lm8-n1]